MAVTQYTYSIAADTLNAKCDGGALREQINANTAITIAVDHINTGGDVLDIYMSAELSAGEETQLTTTVGAHSGLPSVVPTEVSFKASFLGASGLLSVEPNPRSGDAINYYSPNLCDPCSWYEGGTLVSNFQLTATVPLTTYDTGGTHPGPWVDMTHGRMFREDVILAATTTLKPVVQTSVDEGTNWVTKTENSWGLTNNDYSINYSTGVVTFNSVLAVGTIVRASFTKAPATFMWTLKPSAGKRLKLSYAEIQFTDNVVLVSDIIYETWVYNPSDLPNKVKIAELRYKTFRDILWESTGPFPAISAVGGSVRGTQNPMVVLPFQYQAFRDVRSSQGTELRIKLSAPGPQTGEYASCTFYCLQENE